MFLLISMQAFIFYTIGSGTYVANIAEDKF